MSAEVGPVIVTNGEASPMGATDAMKKEHSVLFPQTVFDTCKCSLILGSLSCSLSINTT